MRGLFSQINKPQCLKGKNQVAFCVASPSWKGLTSERTNTKQCWVFFFKTVLLSFQLLKVQSPHFDFPHQFSLTCLCSNRPASSANISLPVGKGGAGRPDRVSKPCWPCWLQESYWDPKFRFLWHRTDSSTWMTYASPEFWVWRACVTLQTAFRLFFPHRAICPYSLQQKVTWGPQEGSAQFDGICFLRVTLAYHRLCYQSLYLTSPCT